MSEITYQNPAYTTDQHGAEAAALLRKALIYMQTSPIVWDSTNSVTTYEAICSGDFDLELEPGGLAALPETPLERIEAGSRIWMILSRGVVLFPEVHGHREVILLTGSLVSRGMVDYKLETTDGRTLVDRPETSIELNDSVNLALDEGPTVEDYATLDDALRELRPIAEAAELEYMYTIKHREDS